VRVLPDPPNRAGLVVIGGGIVGAAAAFYASRAGLDTVLVEERPALCTFTTAVAAGGYRLQLEHREELDLVRRTVDLLERFAEETGQTVHDPGVRRQGYLWLTSDEARMEEQRRLVEQQRAWGVDGVELLSGDEARERFPWLAPSVVQARFRQGDGLIDPRRVTMGLAEGSSAAVVLDCAVTGLEVQRGRLCSVGTSRGAIACERAVVAAGPLSGLVTELAGVRLPIQPLRRQRAMLWNEPAIPADAPMTIDEDTTAHWRPVSGGAYLLYPDPRERPAEPLRQVPADPAFALRLLDPRSPVSLARTASFWADVWERNGAQWAVQAGQYTMTPDQRPLIGETEVEGLFVNTGYSGHGVMGGPAGGELLTRVLTGELRDNPFRLDRAFASATQAF
jgi:D-hydroxyproline dehydrogenase subunit beta